MKNGGASYTSPICKSVTDSQSSSVQEMKEEITMKTLEWSLLVMLVTDVSVLTVMLHTRSPRTLTTDAAGTTETNERSEDDPVVHQPASLATVTVRKPASAVALTPEKQTRLRPTLHRSPPNVMRVPADRVLAKVNDQAILLKHLVPLQPGEQEQAMNPEEYESRLNRAIEMELSFQAAAARGVDLTPEQRKRVDGIAQKHKATLQKYRKQAVTWSSVTLGQVEFEKRLTSALMLQQNLVAIEAHVAPASDPSVQARQEQARSEVLNRLKAQSNISFAGAKL